MHRRQFISGSAAVSLAVAAAVAQAHPGHDHGAHDHQHGAAANPYEAARKAAGHCVSAGQACLAHCIDLLSRGDTSMKDCAAAANQMLALCGALQNLAAQRSPLTPALAKVCAEACKQCAAACKKHAANARDFEFTGVFYRHGFSGCLWFAPDYFKASLNLAGFCLK